MDRKVITTLGIHMLIVLITISRRITIIILTVRTMRVMNQA